MTQFFLLLFVSNRTRFSFERVLLKYFKLYFLFIIYIGDLLRRVVQYYQHMQGYNAGRCSVVWGPAALHALYYFMRCSQLEHAEHGNHRSPVQELVYER